LKFFNDAKFSWENGRGIVEFKGKSISVDGQLMSALNEQANRVFPKHAASPTEKAGRKYLLIITNEDELGFEVPGEVELNDFKAVLP
jgi:hypothetical protein